MSNPATGQEIGPRRACVPVGELNGRAGAGDLSQAEISEEQLRRANSELSQRVAELQRTNAEIQDARHAALNVMEDAVQVRAALAQSDEALRESEQRFREMIDALPAAIYTTDAAGRLTHFNPAAVEFSGRVPKLGTDEWCVSWKLYYPDGTPMPHDKCPMAIALKEGRAVRGAEAIAERPDGRRVWFQPYPTPLRDGEGRIVGGINMLMDITERKQSEEALRRSEQELADFFENAPVGLHWVGPDGTILRVNQAELDLLGYTREEYVGHHIAEFHADQEVISDILQRLARRETLYNHEVRLRCKDGSLKTVFIDSNVLWENGQFIHTRCFTRDITERKQLEGALTQRAAELERLNAELQQFSYIVSHDLNEPLRTMSSFISLLARQYQGKLDATADEYIGFVAKGAQRMQGMITDLLAYTRAGGQAQNFAVVDCAALLTRVLGDLQLAIEDGTAEVTHDVLPTVSGDVGQLGLVFQNLLSNALKFRSERPPCIYVAARREGAQWVFSVRDNGIGLDPQYAERIFQVFQRLHTRSEYPGTGIGLAISKKLVERHGGRIWVESKPGMGATFFFTLPVL